VTDLIWLVCSRLLRLAFVVGALAPKFVVSAFAFVVGALAPKFVVSAFLRL
jgi:hypothetical protein